MWSSDPVSIPGCALTITTETTSIVEVSFSMYIHLDAGEFFSIFLYLDGVAYPSTYLAIGWNVNGAGVTLESVSYSIILDVTWTAEAHTFALYYSANDGGNYDYRLYALIFTVKEYVAAPVGTGEVTLSPVTLIFGLVIGIMATLVYFKKKPKN